MDGHKDEMMRCSWWMILLILPINVMMIFLDPNESVKGWVCGP